MLSMPSRAAHGFRHDPTKARRLLSAMVDLLAGRNLAATHALRESRAGGSPPQRRGADVAQRWDIDHDYHLHYWKRADQSIEFAVVVTHNDFSIPR
ncbi:MAG TPA: hypothetical protein VF331_04350 [Polyangiales bacterium]